MNLFALKTDAQNKVNQVITEGKVKFKISKNEDTGRNEMRMEYSYYAADTSYVTSFKTAPLVRNNATNEMQIDLLVTFALNRADFLNASYYWQAEAQQANVHPQFFKQWFDGIKAGKSENEIFAEVPRLISFGNN